MLQEKLAILGAGNMGASLLKGLIANQYPEDKIWLTDVSAEKLQELRAKFPKIHITQDNQSAVQHASVVLFAVKPQILAEAGTLVWLK